MSIENNEKTKEQKISDLAARLLDAEDPEALQFEILRGKEGRLIAQCELTPKQIEILKLVSEGTGIPVADCAEDALLWAENAISDLKSCTSSHLEDLVETFNFPDAKAKARAEVFAACISADGRRSHQAELSAR